ncbi:MAG: hypothetical protein UV71_C0001G0092 [Microgenomates group bacterium GW2011_GWC1_43_13]|uniref:Uncharacterized protein n=3 Tax=Candidatus Woeseibacteriota TaxID=1752722 RepID=A0A837IC11_9BACT|nr:MAG: hypothetical protein UV71_C0001G0092 [Microgenomates group bacterium GW2011_GWC1_43_13]KKT32836.1 MAG: hypothetical protein UW20_C0008G0010 [Candidatus Woesebacteria bacterium GW2011_GWB1_44_11]KKT54633.1 MAG: hypothetical protein UW47_C0004G0040 [Candidatus Woesebacteria bacterium GW2011_GWA1_44_23]OGM75763.1 MAG: hypothetical protein A2208_01000 [Candidatus Woesebacteria bacterium RIFOXYA1_FULL_43_16]OGM81617.1 MAG: hypothetical protein A2394_02250 [Candidatus Woesebacteria bacterium 
MKTKYKKILIPLFLISVISIGYIILVSLPKGNLQKKTSSIPKTGASYNDLTPGVSTIDDVQKTLGTPVKETQNDAVTLLEYESSNPNFNNEFNLRSGVLYFVKQQVTESDKISITNINEKYGSYEYVLYGPLSTSSFNLYVYPNKGVAYVGNQYSGIVFEIWYFPPTTIEDFKTQYASDYTETLRPSQ